METLVENKWYTNHVDTVWWDNYQELEYKNEQFNDADALEHWKDLGFSQQKFTGDLYDMRNSKPDWIDPFRKVFPWNNFSWSVYRMGPGTVLPSHSDTYAKFRELNSVDDPNTIWRAVVFLENWQSGHYFEIDNRPMPYWKAGNYVVWQNAVKHLAANIGETDRYTLQITGTID